MKLHDLINSPEAHHVSGRPVEFRVFGRNKVGEVVAREARAVFRFVSEQERADCYAKADAEVAKRYEGRAIPSDRQLDERSLYLLHAALRDDSPPHGTFADTPLALRNALVLEEAQRLYREYHAWIAEEFPERISDADMATLVDDAKKNLLVDLLRSSGYRLTLSVLRSLAISGGFPTQT